jgi:hypothetical protein
MLTPAILALALQAAALDCQAFQARIADPAPISFQAISGERLGGKRLSAQMGQYGRFQVGDFIYEGHGIEIHSTDPRFADLVIEPGTGVRHRCGNAVLAPSGWNADAIRPEARVLTFLPMHETQVAPGAVAATEAGIRPVLAGHRVGATWPLYTRGGRVFLGLMHPEDGRRETVIVAFADRRGDVPAMVMARLPERFERLTVVPGLHAPPDNVNLDGFTADRALLQVVLALPEPLGNGLFEAVSVRP